MMHTKRRNSVFWKMGDHLSPLGDHCRYPPLNRHFPEAQLIRSKLTYVLTKYARMESRGVVFHGYHFVGDILPLLTESNTEFAVGEMTSTQRAMISDWIECLDSDNPTPIDSGESVFAPGSDGVKIIQMLRDRLHDS